MDTIVTIDQMVFAAHKIHTLYKDKRNKIEIIVENNILKRVEEYLLTHNIITLGIENDDEEVEVYISDIGTNKEYLTDKSTALSIVFNIYSIKE